MTDIAILRERVQKLTKLLDAAKSMLNAAEVAECGIAVGDVVIHLDQEYRVAEIEIQPRGKPWITGNPRSIMGNSFSGARRRLYGDWKKPKTTS